MEATLSVIRNARLALSGWSWLKKALMTIAVLGFLFSNFMFLTPLGSSIREELAGTVIITQHREWAWLVVGAKRRDEMVNRMWTVAEDNSKEKQEIGRVVVPPRINRSPDELVKVVDIKDENHITPIWKGKMMYVSDPTSIRVVTTSHFQEGEKITDMVKRTGAIAGVNGGAFEDPQGLGNGFAPIGFIKSAGQLLYNAEDGSVPQFTVGFNDKGILVIGKYTLDELDAMHVTDAVFWYPRIIANGNPLEVNNIDGRNPRTAVGQRRDGTVIFVVIDGRSTSSVGATQKEVQDLLLAEGCDNAGFLDGGASSELVVEGDLLTHPASRYGERRLPSAFLVFDHPEDYKPIRIWDGVKKIDAGGAYDNPGFIQEQEELRAKGLLNTPTPTPKPTAKPSPTPEPSRTPSPSGSASPAGESVKPSASPGGATAGSGAGVGVPTPTASTSAAPGASSSPKPAPTAAGTSSPSPAPTNAASGAVTPTPVLSAGSVTSSPAPILAPTTAPTTAPTSTPTASPSAG